MKSGKAEFPGRLINIKARPHTLYVTRNRTVLATDPTGFILPESQNGLFVHQTRLLSNYQFRINGQPPVPVTLSNVDLNTWLGYYVLKTLPGLTKSKIDIGSGQIQPETQRTLELKVARFVENGFHEDIEFNNYTGQKLNFKFEITADADFLDQWEVDAHERLQRGKITKKWHESRKELELRYNANHRFNNQGEKGIASTCRSIRIRFAFENDFKPQWKSGKVVFDVCLEPSEAWHLCVQFTAKIDSQEFKPSSRRCFAFWSYANRATQKQDPYSQNATRFFTRESSKLSNVVIKSLDQAVYDLAGLRLHDLDQNPQSWTMAAGLPIYIALFGRDAITASWQAGLTGPEMMRGTLHILAKLQGKVENDWRDEQPGRMLHEAHTGPLSKLNYFPRARYYGSSTTSLLYPFLVVGLWHWTGDKKQVAPYVEPALKALAWADKYGDLDGDGFYEYKTRCKIGTRNQGWKDSEDAVVYEDGRLVDPPIAMCEEQAFAYASKFHFSEVLWWLGRKDEAKKLYRQARELKERFNDAFWMPDLGFYAMALDSKKNQVRSIGSDAGHSLATGIADKDLVRPVAERLFKPDLFSGWGIRTLSSDHPAFNPYSYHRGSIWPVEHGTFAVGLARYGLHGYAEKLIKSMFEACSLFQSYRLPELFSGHQRNEKHPFPALYPRANSPQAWSSSAIFSFVQSLLGLYPYAPLKSLLIDPILPEWLPEIVLKDLRVGEATITLQFYRQKNGHSNYRVLDRRGTIHVIRQPNPWSLTASFSERTRDAFRMMV